MGETAATPAAAATAPRAAVQVRTIEPVPAARAAAARSRKAPVPATQVAPVRLAEAGLSGGVGAVVVSMPRGWGRPASAPIRGSPHPPLGNPLFEAVFQGIADKLLAAGQLQLP